MSFCEEKFVVNASIAMEQNVADSATFSFLTSNTDRPLKKARTLLEEKKSKEYRLPSLEEKSEVIKKVTVKLSETQKQVQQEEESDVLRDYEDMVANTTETDELLDYEDMVGDEVNLVSKVDKSLKNIHNLEKEKDENDALLDYEDMERDVSRTLEAEEIQRNEETDELLDYEDMVGDEANLISKVDKNLKNIHNLEKEKDENDVLLLDYEDVERDIPRNEETDELLDYEDMVGDELNIVSEVDKNLKNIHHLEKEKDESDVLRDYEDMERDLPRNEETDELLDYEDMVSDELNLVSKVDKNLKNIHSRTLAAKEFQRNFIFKQLYDQVSPSSRQDNYYLLDKLGEGGFGEVWRGKDRNNKECAIKKMQVPCYNPELILTEITNLKQNNHENIPKYVDSFMVSSKEIWMVMEYIAGADVANIIHYSKLNHSSIAAVCHGVLSALRYLHMKRIIHRDVKGDNILVSNQGHVFLVDLGLSVHEESDLKEAGTPGFMAPEVMTTNSYKCSADIWSLGMTFIQMITRRYPYFDCDTRSMREHIIKNSLPPTPKALPEHMTSFHNLCLQYDPSCRASALALLEHEYLEGKAAPQQLALSVKEAMYFKSL